jgi:hypothetical protein
VDERGRRANHHIRLRPDCWLKPLCDAGNLAQFGTEAVYFPVSRNQGLTHVLFLREMSGRLAWAERLDNAGLLGGC